MCTFAMSNGVLWPAQQRLILAWLYYNGLWWTVLHGTSCSLPIRFSLHVSCQTNIAWHSHSCHQLSHQNIQEYERSLLDNVHVGLHVWTWILYNTLSLNVNGSVTIWYDGIIYNETAACSVHDVEKFCLVWKNQNMYQNV